MAERQSPVKDAIYEVLQEKGALTKEELVEEVYKRASPYMIGNEKKKKAVIKAIITRLVNKGVLKVVDGKITL